MTASHDGTTAIQEPLREREVARILGVSVKTLRHWRLKRLGPKYLKLVGVVRYRQQDVEEFMGASVR